MVRREFTNLWFILIAKAALACSSSTLVIHPLIAFILQYRSLLSKSQHDRSQDRRGMSKLFTATASNFGHLTLTEKYVFRARHRSGVLLRRQRRASRPELKRCHRTHRRHRRLWVRCECASNVMTSETCRTDHSPAGTLLATWSHR